MQKNNKKIIYVIIIILELIGIICGIVYIICKTNQNTQTVSSVPIENNVEKNDMVYYIIPKRTNNKINYLAKVTQPVYKKNEKDIKIPIIIYHAFSSEIPKDDIYKLFSTGKRFEENITTLLKEEYTFITLEDLYKYNKGEIGLPEKVCILTMDDGWLGCYSEAFPVLKKYKVPATIFMVNDLVGTPGYFSWEQAKEMYYSGYVKLHIHGKSHINYASVNKEKLISDYTTAHAELEEKMGEEIQKIMAYPAGGSSANSIKWLKEIGFEIQVLTKYGTVNKSRDLDLTNLGRIRGERATGTKLLNIIKNADK